MRLELVKLQEAVGITFVIVTHDQSEAMAIADRIAVLNEGRLRQVATPSQLYQQPVDAFVADFVGTIHSFSIVYKLNELVGNAVLAVRPEHIELALGEPASGDVALAGRLGDIAFQGLYSIVEIMLDNRASLTAIASNTQAQALQQAGPGSTVWAHWDAANMLLLPNDASSNDLNVNLSDASDAGSIE